jgi:hypothetical protein
VGILGFAVLGGRPVIGGSPHSARSLGYFARYVIPTDGVPEIVIGAFAGLAVADAVLPNPTTGQVVAGYALVLCLYLLPSDDLTERVVGGCGIVATFWILYRDDGCTSPLSEGDKVWLVGLLVLVAGVHLATRLGLVPFARHLPGWMPPGKVVLVVFGVLETALFVVRPNGLEIWDGAPPGARPLALALIAVIALLGSYAPLPVVALLAVGVTLGQLVLIAVELQLLAAQPVPDPCRSPLSDMAWMAGFVAVAGFARSVRGIGSK